MFTRTLFAMTLAAALFATGCAKKEEPKEEPMAEAPAVDLAAEEQAVRNRSAEWMNFINAKDVDSTVGVYASDAIGSFNDKIIKGSDAIRSAIEKEFKDTPDAVVSWTTSSVKLSSSGDMAVEKGDYYFDPDGNGKKAAKTGTFVTVWEKVDGTWRAISDIGAENPPAA